MPKIVQFNQYGDADVLQLVEQPLRSLAPGEVLIGVKAFGVQRADVLWRQGQYIQAPEKFPAGLGYDCVGIIRSVGEGVSSWNVGDRVATLPGFSLTKYSVYGEAAIIHQDFIVPLPDVKLSWEELAAIPVPYYTGYFPLFEIADLKQAKYILIPAASSSTGIAAIQFAKAEGVTVIATSRTSIKRQAILALGADHFIASEEQNVVDVVREIVGERGADIIYDPIGGKMIEKWCSVIKRGGFIIHYGLLDLNEPTLPIMLSVMKTVTLKSYMIFEFTGNESLALPRNSAAFSRAIAHINQGFKEGHLKPVVAKSFDLNDVTQSHRYLESNQQIGKIVVRTSM